jgi:hypothetical protein
MRSLIRSKPRKRTLLAAFVAVWLGIGTWQVHKPLPPGTNVRTAAVAIDPAQLQFLTDLTFIDANGNRQTQQEIFNAVFALIDEAQTFIVADFFLFNESMGAQTGVHRRLSAELTERLLARKKAQPQLRVLLITDPVNEIYGGSRSEWLSRLRAGGIEVVTTDLTRLRDSNPAYSALWRLAGQWWGNSTDGGALMNPFGGQPAAVTLRSWLSLLNFKANHRKGRSSASSPRRTHMMRAALTRTSHSESQVHWHWRSRAASSRSPDFQDGRADGQYLRLVSKTSSQVMLSSPSSLKVPFVINS